METVTKILTSEFLWGIVIGLLVAFAGGWWQARITRDSERKYRKEIVRDFSIDTIKNLQSIVKQMDAIRDRGKVIDGDYLALIGVELDIFGRNREHLIHLPREVRGEVREFMNEIAVKRAQIGQYLQNFNNMWAQANAIQAEGRGPEAQRVRTDANVPLAEAHKSADKLANVASGGANVVSSLEKVKV